ncbi:hypothetical protein GCM10027187_06180 [Streptosporangium sandarakinum]|uniref:DUF4132 domain-containing protein n=1 Tax=Streptosporangium sandarakinum TaxID=1260955 RepID=A0A852V7B4_9ACTN|nr:DUF4132 domain-containing protein [Streptosporangium sandarakinum]NYF41925.1 hypothetical protein [Streptosporangium sandarakinum]
MLRLIRSVAERDIDWTLVDARLLVHRAGELVHRGHTRYEEIYRIPFAAACRFGFQERRELLGRLAGPSRRSGSRTQGRRVRSEQAREALAERLQELLTEPPGHGPAGVVHNMIWECDDFARLLAEEYGPRLAAPEALPLLRHWNTARSAKPSARWLRQPYKQAFREVYLLTPAEERTGTFSNRFAGHVLRYGQAKTLLNQRGWTGLSIGHWDYECGGDQGAAVRELSGWRARWGMHVVSFPEADGWDTASLCASEQITFHRDGHEDYWHSCGFGELTETARTRRDVLARLLPRLRIADPSITRQLVP